MLVINDYGCRKYVIQTNEVMGGCNNVYIFFLLFIKMGTGLSLFYQVAPKCEKHDVSAKPQMIYIKTSKDLGLACDQFGHQFWICEKCHPKKERTEDFYKKIALDHMKEMNSSCKLSDILGVDVWYK